MRTLNVTEQAAAYGLTTDEVLELAARLKHERLFTKETTLTRPGQAADFIAAWLRDRDRECFGVLFLDTRHRVIAAEVMFMGTLDGAQVYPRVIAKRALDLNAAALILAHNHPSGVADPSEADKMITDRLRQAMQLLDIRVLDHFIVGDGAPVSMAARGMI